ncbi:MAG: hypothetical protein WD097_00475 [Balneolales bacterium]
MINRRKALKILSTIPVGGMLAGRANGLTNPALWGEESGQTGPLTYGSEIYESIGVDPVINCRGTFTIIGGSVHRPEVEQAMAAAAQNYVQMDELADGVGRRLAELTGAEWGMVSSGCAGAMKHATAACVAGGNPEKLTRIPDMTGLDKTEVVVPRPWRNNYDHAIRNIGVKVITVETQEELARALNPKTAMVYLCTYGSSYNEGEPFSIKPVADIVRPHNIPILVDAAAEELSVRPNIHLEGGATLVAYSGGKCIRGPQCAGLLLGNKKLIMSAWQASSPHHGPGRDNKVGREETLGMLAAVEAWVKRDPEAEWQTWISYLETIANRVSGIDTVQTQIMESEGYRPQAGKTFSGWPDGANLNNRSPRLVISWDPDRLNMTGDELADFVARNRPKIALGAGSSRGASIADNATAINITSFQMRPSDDKVVADRLYEILTADRSPRSDRMASPGANLTGRWEVDVEFFSSESRHTFFLEQDNNWLQGAHKGDFSMRDIAGTIEGNEVKLMSVERRPGNSIRFIFAGRLSGDTITGDVYMGEYLNAKFTARAHSYGDQRREVDVPTGHPMTN